MRNLPVTGKQTVRALLATLAATLLLAAAALAGPYEDANALYKQSDYQGALRILRQLTQDEPDNARAYLLTGLASNKLGDANGAREAWDHALQIDPNLRVLPTDRQRQQFAQVYRAVGGRQGSAAGDAPSARGGRGRGRVGADPIIAALTNGNVYVHPNLKGEVDPGRLEEAARQAGNAKIVATTTVYPYKSPTEMAARLREALNLGEGVVVVGTPKRIGASSGRLGSDQIERALQGAGLEQANSRGGLTEALAQAALATRSTVRSDRTADNGSLGGLLFAGAAGVGGFALYRAAKKRRALSDAKAPVETLRRQTLDNLSYVDGYLDLLPAGADADRARTLRQEAYDKYARATALLQGAQTPADVSPTEPLYRDALVELEECRAAIDKATGGTGVAMSIPELPSLATDVERAHAARLKPVETVRSEDEARRLQAEIEQIPPDQRGVSFFSGRPLPASELVPVTLVIGGQKRTVMASRDEAEAMRRGETPQVRAFEQDGRHVPWYENRGYDPYRDYYGGYGGGGFGSLVNLYLLSQVFGGGMFGGYGGWGFGGIGYGGPTIVNNNYYGGGAGNDNGGGFFGGGDGGTQAVEQPVEHAGGFDFFGQQGYDDTSPDSGGGGFDFGGGDSGGGDFGGGDFGGGDF